MSVVGIAIVAYNISEQLDDLLGSLKSDKHDLRIYLHKHSTDEMFPEVARVCEKWATDSRVSYYPHNRNQSLSLSWSLGMIQAFEEDNASCCLVVNDDILYGPGDVDRFVGFVEDIAKYEAENPDAQKCGMVTTLGFHAHYSTYPQMGEQCYLGFGFSNFAVTRVGWDVLQCFDVNFAPIYLEDCDFGRRLYLSGLCMKEVKTMRCIHWGSLSANDAELQKQHAITSPRSYEFYKAKWGSTATDSRFYMGTETFSTPFGDPDRTLKIPWQTLRNPHGPLYDRTDLQEIIKR